MARMRRIDSITTFAILLLGALALPVAPVQAQGSPPPPASPYKFSGLVFGDFYDFVREHQANFDGQNGFWLRRIYFTFDQTLSPAISMRLRLEMNSNGAMTSANLTPFVKDASVRWTYYGRQQVTLGIQPTATIDFFDTFWGLRHVEKTAVDLYKLDSTRDFGIGFSGPLTGDGALKYVAQLGNDSGQNSETDRNKALRLELRYESSPGLMAEACFASFSRPFGADRTIWQGIVGYQNKSGRAALQYVYQLRKAPTGTTQADVKLHAISGFGVYHIVPQTLSVFARVDRFQDPLPDGKLDYLPIDQKEPFTFVTGGLEYYLLPALRVGPNVEFVKYGTPASGVKPKDDLAVRVTFFWTW